MHANGIAPEPCAQPPGLPAEALGIGGGRVPIHAATLIQTPAAAGKNRFSRHPATGLHSVCNDFDARAV
jgi:hypothetical protein